METEVKAVVDVLERIAEYLEGIDASLAALTDQTKGVRE